MTIALYAGSFDPITLGHLDIIERGIKIFDKLIVAVANNPEKQGFIPIEKRIELIKNSTKNINNIEVFSFSGLTVDFAKKHGATVLIRGLRNLSDFEYENQLAQINYKLDKNIQTIFFTSKAEYSHISSSCVRELVSHKYSLSEFVPQCVSEYLYGLY